MSTSKTILRAKVIYLSSTDESAFFYWLDRIPCVDSYGGELDVLDIVVNRKKVNNESLRELIALFFRYDIELSQLRQFHNRKNDTWLNVETKFWFKRMFRSG